MQVKRIFYVVLLCALLPMVSYAETREQIKERRSELRLLMGDMLWETLIWHDDTHRFYDGLYYVSPDAVFTENRNYRWSPHMGLEYQYRLRTWVSLGLQVDGQLTTWDCLRYNTDNEKLDDLSYKGNFYNISVLPTVRFTYLHHKYVNMYSAIGVGVDINGGTETDIYGKKTAVGMALDIAVLGLSVGNKNWFGSVEVGGLSAMKNKDTIFMLASRLLTVGVGVRF